MKTKDKCPYNNGHESMLLLVVDTDAIIFIIMKMPIERLRRTRKHNSTKTHAGI